MAMTLCELRWLRSLLRNIHVKINCPTILHCDRQAAICFATNPVFYELTNHIEICCHFVRSTFQEGFISLCYIRSELQHADYLYQSTSSYTLSIFSSQI